MELQIIRNQNSNIPTEKIILDGKEITGVTSYHIHGDFKTPGIAKLQLELIVSLGPSGGGAYIEKKA